MVERHEVWVAEPHADVVGFVGLRPGWVDHMYVDPRAQNAGIGTAMLDHAKRLHPGGLQLWAFQQNVGAHRFYLRHGFHVVERTSSEGNIEREPDARYEWVP
jgi:GNAT superfamily N-acetyltransferase